MKKIGIISLLFVHTIIESGGHQSKSPLLNQQTEPLLTEHPESGEPKEQESKEWTSSEKENLLSLIQSDNANDFGEALKSDHDDPLGDNDCILLFEAAYRQNNIAILDMLEEYSQGLHNKFVTCKLCDATTYENVQQLSDLLDLVQRCYGSRNTPLGWANDNKSKERIVLNLTSCQNEKIASLCFCMLQKIWNNFDNFYFWKDYIDKLNLRVHAKLMRHLVAQNRSQTGPALLTEAIRQNNPDLIAFFLNITNTDGVPWLDLNGTKHTNRDDLPFFLIQAIKAQNYPLLKNESFKI